TPWEDLTGAQILKAMSEREDFAARLLALAAEANAAHAGEDEEDEHEHHHHHYDENGVCSCGHHHHDHDEDEHEHHHEDEEHEHHHHEEEHEHHHHDEDEHHHDGEGHCCHHHHHHHGHDADEVFTSWGIETARTYTRADIEHALDELESGKYGMILRSKGIVDGGADGWLEYDYVPGEREVRSRTPDVGGK